MVLAIETPVTVFILADMIGILRPKPLGSFTERSTFDRDGTLLFFGFRRTSSNE
jgi:hypothetical protein